jgi:molybdopterin-containing oxidoreductase family iron-sulfur binding subunit
MNRIRRSEPTDVPDNKPAAEITADAIASRRGGYWRSLDELADTEAYRAFVEKEFPGLAEELTAPSSRRDFFRVMGASLAMASLTACRWPKELIVPYANRPEGRIPGVPVQYASALELGGSAVGVLVSSYDGRPVKIEGNPLHPASLGAADAFMQAAVLELYDPDRSRQVVRRESGKELPQTVEAFDDWAREQFAALRTRRGAGLAILAEASSSPTLAALRARLAGTLPAARWHEYEPISRDNERSGTALLFGAPLRPVLHLEHARTIVCLDADPLGSHPAALANAREFAASRTAENGAMSRLWVAESALSITGGAADHRVALPPSAVASLAATLAGRFIKRIKSSTWGPLEALVQTLAGVGDESLAPAFAAGVLADLERDLGRAVVVAGPRQPAEVHALVALMNVALGAVGGLVTYVADDEPCRPPHVEALRALCADLAAGTVDTLLILGGNPVYDAPADLDFAACLKRAASSVHLSLYDNETSRGCRWHVPRAHALESWGDARAWDGTYSVVQPLIEPLYGGRTPIEAVAALLGEDGAKGHDLVRRTFAVVAPAGAGDAQWRRALHDGVLASSAPVPVEPRERFDGLQPSLGRIAAAGGWRRAGQIEAVFVADRKVYDGRFANNAWLQELPEPLTKIAWDNAALLSPATAARLGVATGDLVKVALGPRTLEIVAYVMPGQADDTVVLPLGYGRAAAGHVGDGAGFDTYVLRTAAAPDTAADATVEPTGRRYPLALTQDHHAIDEVGFKERGLRVAALVREGTLAEYLKHPEFVKEMAEEPPPAPLFRELVYDGEHQWGMAIDLNACIGCGACTIACQAENNIAVVGKEQVARGREMHWIRVDRYFAGKPEDPKVVFQPIACQHCENAPCEQVCPVAATVHSSEGLNEMVYNRCVGTRYCSNNCPYKVRRFNYLNYRKQLTQVEKMAFNPEVTVRSRGVMEKCTYCVQRIETVKIAARNDRRPIRDGEIVPACAQTCPTQAITFGDVKNPESRVAKLHAHHRAYGILGELHTRPRTRYLAKLRNPAAEGEEA